MHWPHWWNRGCRSLTCRLQVTRAAEDFDVAEHVAAIARHITFNTRAPLDLVTADLWAEVTFLRRNGILSARSLADVGVEWHRLWETRMAWVDRARPVVGAGHPGEGGEPEQGS